MLRFFARGKLFGLKRADESPCESSASHWLGEKNAAARMRRRHQTRKEKMRQQVFIARRSRRAAACDYSGGSGSGSSISFLQRGSPVRRLGSTRSAERSIAASMAGSARWESAQSSASSGAQVIIRVTAAQ